MRILQIGGAVILGLGAAGYGVWNNSRKYVYIDNGFDEAITVKVDGKSQTLAPNTFVKLSVTGGQKLPVESKLPSGKTEKYTVQVPAVGTFSNWEGVYNVGKEGRYALIQVTYNNVGGKTKADPIGEGEKFFEIPPSARGGMFDVKFPSSIKSKSSSTTYWRVCRVLTGKDDEVSIPCAE